jgi:hypothetical protein
MKVMVIVKATKDSEAGVMPSRELVTAMGNYNEELVKARIMLAGDGLNPMPGESDVEIRPVYELTDFGENFTPEAREKEERRHEQIAKRKVS